MGAALAWNNSFNELGKTITTSFNGVQMTSEVVDPAYPATNAVDPDPSKVTRVNYVRNAVGGGSSQMRYIHNGGLVGGDRLARVLAVLNMRIPSDCTNVALFARDAATGNIWSIFNIGPSELVPKPGTTDRYDIYAVGPASTLAGTLCVSLSLPPSTSGYWELGHVWMSDALIFDDGVSGDWRLGNVDPSEVERTRGGALVATVIPHRRTLSVSMDSKTYAQAMGTPGTPANLSYRKFMADAGNSSPLVILPRTPLLTPTTDELHALQTMGMYCSMVGTTDIGHAGGNLFRHTANFEEIR